MLYFWSRWPVLCPSSIERWDAPARCLPCLHADLCADCQVDSPSGHHLPQWTFNAVGEFELNRKKPSTVDCTLRPSPTEPCLSPPPSKTNFSMDSWRHDGFVFQCYWQPEKFDIENYNKGHNQHSLLSVGWTVKESSLNNECNCVPDFLLAKWHRRLILTDRAGCTHLLFSLEFVCGSSWQRRKWTENTMSKAPVRPMNVSFV